MFGGLKFKIMMSIKTLLITVIILFCLRIFGTINKMETENTGAAIAASLIVICFYIYLVFCAFNAIPK